MASLTLPKYPSCNKAAWTSTMTLSSALHRDISGGAEQSLCALNAILSVNSFGNVSFLICSDLYFQPLSPGTACVFQLEYVGWQLNLQMAQSSQARLKSPSAVLQLGLNSEDSEVRTHRGGMISWPFHWFLHVCFFSNSLVICCN